MFLLLKKFDRRNLGETNGKKPENTTELLNYSMFYTLFGEKKEVPNSKTAKQLHAYHYNHLGVFPRKQSWLQSPLLSQTLCCFFHPLFLVSFGASGILLIACFLFFLEFPCVGITIKLLKRKYGGPLGYAGKTH